MVMHLHPLEKVFERVASTHRSSFPNTTIDYSLLYKGLVQHLRSNIYKDVDAGLAANTAEHGLYTAHNSEHFDEVILYAGELLGVKDGSEEINNISPYELYVLLVAIRVHDAGNIHGREEHEKKCFTVLRNCGAASGEDDAEKKIIGNIAQAHGGRTSSGDKDTIGALEQSYGISRHPIRPRLIAAIVRLADEICESRRRASNYLIQHGKIPKHSELFHRYAASITESSITLADRRISLRYTVKLSDAIRAWCFAVSGDKTESFLIDEIFERLEKMDRERKYCNRFSKEIYTIDEIRASIDVVNDDYDVVHQISVPGLFDFGYPESNGNHLKLKLAKYCGPDFWKSCGKTEEGK
jgi:hypothetical protein